MNFLRWLWHALTQLVAGLLPGRPFERYSVVYVEDLPIKLRRQILYVVGERGVHYQASMLCPDGCGTVINLNLLPDDNPRWHLTLGENLAPSLRPSVWRREACGAHFFVRNGRIVWCKDAEE